MTPKAIAGTQAPNHREPRPRAFLYTPFVLMVASCWFIATGFWDSYHPSAVGFPVIWSALIAIPVSVAFSFAYLAFDAWWHSRHLEEGWSPWLVPSIAAIGAVLYVVLSLN